MSLKTHGLSGDRFIYAEMTMTWQKLMVHQDRHSLMAVVSQDRFHCPFDQAYRYEEVLANIYKTDVPYRLAIHIKGASPMCHIAKSQTFPRFTVCQTSPPSVPIHEHSTITHPVICHHILCQVVEGFQFYSWTMTAAYCNRFLRGKLFYVLTLVYM